MTPSAGLTDGPIRPLTPQQQCIADGIGDGLSYAEIGARCTSAKRPQGITAASVRQQVKAMALLFDNPHELPPRVRIALWVRHRRWLARHESAAAD